MLEKWTLEDAMERIEWAQELDQSRVAEIRRAHDRIEDLEQKTSELKRMIERVFELETVMRQIAMGIPYPEAVARRCLLGQEEP